MTKQITDNKRKRLERNERIKARYHNEMANGGMSSAVIGGICRSYRMTPPTVYSILQLDKKEKEDKKNDTI